MSAHDREHEEWVARMLADGLDPETPEAGARLAACPQCRHELAVLVTLAADLRTLTRQEREDLAQASSEVDRADLDLVRSSLKRALGAKRAPTRRPVVLALAAAGVLFLIGWALQTALRDEPRSETLLGDDAIECLAPIELGDYDEFRWRYDGPHLGTFTLRIFILEGDERGDEVQTKIVDEPRWTPSAQERAALPERIYWEVETRALDGFLVRGHARAWRRR